MSDDPYDPKVGSTALMSPEQIERERRMFEAQESLWRAQARAKHEKAWSTVGLAAPWAAAFVVAIVLGVAFFVCLDIMADAWERTDWIW